MNTDELVEELQQLRNGCGNIEVRVQDDGESKTYGLLGQVKFDEELNIVIVTIDTYGEIL